MFSIYFENDIHSKCYVIIGSIVKICYEPFGLN